MAAKRTRRRIGNVHMYSSFYLFYSHGTNEFELCALFSFISSLFVTLYPPVSNLYGCLLRKYVYFHFSFAFTIGIFRKTIRLFFVVAIKCFLNVIFVLRTAHSALFYIGFGYTLNDIWLHWKDLKIYIFGCVGWIHTIDSWYGLK